MDNPDVFNALRKLDTETPAAYEAFLDYVNMGADRSIRKLVDQYRQQKVTKPPSTRLETLIGWSRDHQWQARIGRYLEELQKLNIEQQKEFMEGFLKNVRTFYDDVAEQIRKTIEDFQTTTTTKRKRVPHPSKEGMELEIVVMKPNTNELRQLVEALDRLQKGTRAALGLPANVDITSGGEKLKGYVNVNPDEWDEPSDE